MTKHHQKKSDNSEAFDREALYDKLNVMQRHSKEETDNTKAVSREILYDKLTELPNQHLLYDRLGQEMASSKRTGRYMALMYIGLNDFQPVNDQQSQKIGNLLLIEVASRIKECVREVDSVARASNNNFIVMLNELTREKTQSVTQAHVIAEKIHTALAYPYPVIIKNEKTEDTVDEFNCRISMGVVVFTNDNMSRDDVLGWAERSMYKAQESGSSEICFSDTYI